MKKTIKDYMNVIKYCNKNFSFAQKKPFGPGSLPYQVLIKDLSKTIKNTSDTFVIAKSRQCGVSSLFHMLEAYYCLNSNQHLEFINVYPTRTIATVSSKNFDQIIKPKKSSLLVKEFDNGTIKFTRADKNYFRGYDADYLFYDEAKEELYHGINSTCIYSTMDKTSDLWLNSSQNEFFFVCADCNKQFQLNPKNWRRIWKKDNTIRCPKCAFCQPKNIALDNGIWISQNKSKYPGYNLNMNLLPGIPRSMLSDYEKHTSAEIFAHEAFGA